MKKILFTFALMVVALTAWADDAVKTAYFTVNPPMECSNCENKIKSNLRYESGVKSIDACAQRGIVEIRYDANKTSVEQLVNAFAKIGYKAEVCNPEAAQKCDGKGNCKGESKCTDKKSCTGKKECQGDKKCTGNKADCKGDGTCKNNGTCRGEGTCKNNGAGKGEGTCKNKCTEK